MAGSNANDILLADLCVAQHLARVNKQYVLAAPLGAAGAEPTAIAALGCQPVVSSRQGGGNTAVLSRFNQANGGYLQTLLTSPDGSSRSQPGPTSHLAAARGLNLAGVVANPFPLSRASFTAQFFFGSDLWFLESAGGFQLQHAAGHQFFGFGGGQAPYWTLNLPPGRTFNGVPSGRLENHTYDNYLRMPVVSYGCEPLALGFSAVDSWYAWSVRSPQLTIHTNQVGGGGTGERWDLTLYWQEVHPALVASTGPSLSAALEGDGSANGAGLFRSYCYKALDANVVIPDFGGSLSKTYSVPQGDLRPPLVVYTLDDGGATQPAVGAYSLSFEGLSSSPTAAALPTPQRNSFDSGLGPVDFDFNNCTSFQVPTLTVKTEAGTGRQFVGLDFTVTVAGGFSQTGTLEYVKDPLVSLATWLATPRYYEILVMFQHQTGLL